MADDAMPQSGADSHCTNPQVHKTSLELIEAGIVSPEIGNDIEGVGT
jgi:hypothetical protein